MSDFGSIKARIADEMNRSDLTSQIGSAVVRAIEYYARERTVFNEDSQTGATVADTETVDFPSGLRFIDAIFATVGSNKYKMHRVDWDDLEEMHAHSDSKGQPISYAVRNGQIRIFPTPNTAYTITFNGIYDATPAITTDSADDVTNGWMTGMAAELIVSRATYTICRSITFDSEMMSYARIAETEALRDVRSEANNLVSTGGIKPGWP